jgi:hypothetical protein
LIILVVGLISGCASDHHTYSTLPAAKSSALGSPEAAIVPAADSESMFAGVWQGSTLADCGVSSSFPSRCNAEQNVSMRLVQGPNSKITGRYTYSYRNIDCYHLNETGKVIDVSINCARMNIRVIMPDATSCIFTGLNLDQAINGGYTCYQGGALIRARLARAALRLAATDRLPMTQGGFGPIRVVSPVS